MEIKLEFGSQEDTDQIDQALEICLIRRYYYRIVAVADVVSDTQRLLHEPVELVQVDIGKQLTGDVAERNTRTRLGTVTQDNGTD
jgi:hypothetical protein